MFTRIMLTGMKREINFPFQIRSVGLSVRANNKQYHYTCEDHVEFCIRYKSEEKEVVDEVDGIPYRVRFPHVAVKQPFRNHKYAIGAPRDAIAFTYFLPEMERLREIGLMPDVPVFEIDISRELNVMIRETIDLMAHTREYGTADRLDLLCFRMAEELMFLRKNRVPIDTMAQKIHSIASYLQLNFLELIDFDELAMKHGLSRCTFYRQWSRYFQQTPAQFLLNLRLEWAKEQLAYSRIKICDLTSELHFSTVAYFCAIFKKQFGMTPLQYQKNQGRNQQKR